MRLIINGQDIELFPNVTIARTLQVNDIGSPQTRQASYTNTFNIPRTSSNTKIFDMLGVIGTDSNIPYQKNEAYLYDDSGFCLVYKGWAVISETANDFKCNIYDGIIDFYKAIENKTLGDLDLSALTHIKTPAEVASTQNKSKPYVYIVGDYNGDSTSLDPTDIKSDYLIPSVKIPWIWEKIEAFTGYQLNGTFKTNTDFTNLYLTFPKNTPPTLETNILVSSDLEVSAPGSVTFVDRIVYALIDSTTVYNSTKINLGIDKKTITSLQAISISVTFVINPNLTVPSAVPYTPYAIFNGQRFLCDGTSRTLSNIYNLFDFYQQINFPFQVDFELDQEFTGTLTIPNIFQSVTIKELVSETSGFKEFGGMTIKQFISEILWRFNLTMFADKYSNQYTLKYLSEIVNAPSIDWSDKFDSLGSENYIYGNYAQRSYLRYKYNEVNDFNDFYLSIQNENLPDLNTIIQSDAYSPEFEISKNLGFDSKLYKFWDKEIKDNSTVTYKSLQGRKYFLRATQVNTSVDFISDDLSTSQASSLYQKENFTGLSFTEIVNSYYSEMAFLLNQSKVLNVTLRLTEIDIVNMDFSKPVYIKQLGGSFLVNKIQNFIPFRDTKVELIKISK